MTLHVFSTKQAPQPSLSWASVLVLFFLLHPLFLLAEPINAEMLDLELFSIQDGKLVRLSKLAPQTTLVNFWRTDCPPCVKELPILMEISTRLNVRLITVSVQTLTETKTLWVTVPGQLPQHIALIAPSNPTGILRRFGNTSGAIPYSVMLNTKNQMCSKHTGEIDKKWIEAAMLKCQVSI
jgi:thiol-disulfide isomerase/thioredoxin